VLGSISATSAWFLVSVPDCTPDPLSSANAVIPSVNLRIFGDTMNVTARLQEYCKTIGAALVVSGELLRNIEMPVGLEISDRGDIVLRSRERPLDASVVHPTMGFL
jgi:class 3 adenylate cyclase